MSSNAMLHNIILQSNSFYNFLPVLSCPVLSCPVLSCPVLSCPVLSYPIFFLLLHCPALSSTALLCPLLSPPAVHCLLLISHFLTSHTLHRFLLSRRFGDAYCEFPKRLRVIEEVRAMVKTIMTTDDSAGTSLQHTHTHTHTLSLSLTVSVIVCDWQTD